MSVASHPLTEGVAPEDLKFADVGKVTAPIESPLFLSGGEPFAALRSPGEIVIAARWSTTGWAARPSFPIFWANVINYAASGAGAWTASGLLDEAASRPGTDQIPLDLGPNWERPVAPVRTDLTAVAIALAGLLLAALWSVERRQAAAA